MTDPNPPRCDWQHPTATSWQCVKALGHTDVHFMLPPTVDRHVYCSRCGSGPLINDAHFDGVECGDCVRRLTPEEQERIG